MRKKHTWNVTLQASTGEVVERKVSNYWDPSQEDAADAIQTAARVEAWWESGQKVQFHPISAALAD